MYIAVIILPVCLLSVALHEHSAAVESGCEPIGCASQYHQPTQPFSHRPGVLRFKGLFCCVLCSTPNMYMIAQILAI